MNLRPYQNEAADFLFANDRAMILAPVGAGKTAITLTAMQAMLTSGHVSRFLVLPPSVWPSASGRPRPGCGRQPCALAWLWGRLNSARLRSDQTVRW